MNTSKTTYKKIKENINAEKYRISKILYHNKKALTASEVTFKYNISYPKRIIRNNTASRLSSLAKSGRVIRDGFKLCPITDKTVIAWRFNHEYNKKH